MDGKMVIGFGIVSLVVGAMSLITGLITDPQQAAILTLGAFLIMLVFVAPRTHRQEASHGR